MALQNNLMGDTRLMRVREGMNVYDANNNHIGSVRYVYSGETDAQVLEEGMEPAEAAGPDMYESNKVVEAITELFDPGHLPEELRERMWQAGFIQIDTSWLLASDRYALPDQVASIMQDEVQLNVPYDTLLHL